MKALPTDLNVPLSAEWLETDGLGGFASGTVALRRTRRYHALLMAQTPAKGRYVLVNGFDAWVDTSAGSFALSSQRYTPAVVHPDGSVYLREFAKDPWPRWEFQLPDGTCLTQEIWIPKGRAVVVVTWRLSKARPGVRLRVRPFVSGRDYHALHHENPEFGFNAEVHGSTVTWQPYPSLPRIVSQSNGQYRHDPWWYRHFEYEAERERGLDFTEDLASPGEMMWDLSADEAVWVLATGESAVEPPPDSLTKEVRRWRRTEQRRRSKFPSALHRAADAYLVRRGSEATLIAGYPWFTDWGRDTFIALRGLCLATGRLKEAREILLSWARCASLGMLPNRFPDQGEKPEFNAVDASLWFIVVVYEFLAAARKSGFRISAADRAQLATTVEAILEGYVRGTRHHIQATDDGLLACGEPGVQLTWMDARVGDWVVTPRVGKPVEVQALWVNALWIGSQFQAHWRPLYEQARAAFGQQFWNEERQCLWDVVDVDHVPGRKDPAVRPNQIFALGGLPLALIEGERARALLQCVEEQLLTPLGLRSLAPGEPSYAPRYEGGVSQRDGTYHQGTVWPWLIGPFTEAWLRAHGTSTLNRLSARERFLAPLRAHLDRQGLGHIAEIADAEPPHTPRGCPAQAWSLGEFLRLELQVLAAQPAARRCQRPSSAPSLHPVLT